VHEFVAERLEALLGVPVEFVRAARGSAPSQLGQIAALATALARLPERQLDAVHTVYTRSERLAGKHSDQAAASVDGSLLVDEAEREVVATLDAVAPRIETAIVAGDFDTALAVAAELGRPLDRFFEDVLVMADDGAVRANRLRLLLDVRDAVGTLGDFGQIPR
jgi:glycyl-tRNA synthetase beta chain